LSTEIGESTTLRFDIVGGFERLNVVANDTELTHIGGAAQVPQDPHDFGVRSCFKILITADFLMKTAITGLCQPLGFSAVWQFESSTKGA